MGETYNTLITPHQAFDHLSDQDWLFVDCTFYLQNPEKGFSDYLEYHLPHAVYAHLDNDLSGKITPTTGRHPLPEKHEFEASLQSWGFLPGMQIVAYDSAGGSMAAARLWWLMNYFNLPKVAILDGGIQNWLRHEYPVTALLPNIHRTDVDCSLNEDLLVNYHIVRSYIRKPGCTILDGRAPNRFHGLDEIIDPIPGHIPGAKNLPVSDFLTDDLTLKSPALIWKVITEQLNNNRPQDTIYYCGSGVTAAFGIFSMTYAGFTGVRLYPGSWSEWIRQPWAEIASK